MVNVDVPVMAEYALTVSLALWSVMSLCIIYFPMQNQKECNISATDVISNSEE